MGVIKRGILGGFSGKVGNVVGSSWKGIAVIKSQPLSVANPQTAGQTNQRNKFSGAVVVAKILLAGLIKPLWDRFAQGQSGYNAWMSANIENFTTAGAPVVADLEMSSGSLALDDIDSVSGTNGSPTATVTWTSSEGTGNALATDEAYAVVYNADQDMWGIASGTDTRTDETTDVTMPANQATGEIMHAYLSFRKADGTLVSNSDYSNNAVSA